MERVYIKPKRFVQIQKGRVTLGDVAEVYAKEKTLKNRIKTLTVHQFRQEVTEKRVVLSALVLVQKIEEACGSIQVELSGEPDILVEWLEHPTEKTFLVGLKIVFVCLVTFFGTGFTIMAYHNDIGIVTLFREVYRIFMGTYPEGPNVLEITYSIGLALGIIVFYNHIGKRKLTKDPTPMEVAMYQYEQSVDFALMELADRQGREQEAGGQG